LFIKLNYVLQFVTILAKTVQCGNVSYYKFISPSFQIIARQVNSKVALTISYNFNAPSFKKFHTKAVEGKGIVALASTINNWQPMVLQLGHNLQRLSQ